MPPMIFQATCAACAQPRKFIEFKAEPCTPRVAAGGEDAPPGAEGERRYGFRCLGCKTIVPELVDLHGGRHSWTDGKHVEA